MANWLPDGKCLFVLTQSTNVTDGHIHTHPDRHRTTAKGMFIATQFNSTQLNLTRQREQQLTQFVGRDVINKWLYAVQLGQLSSVELSCVAINTR